MEHAWTCRCCGRRFNTLPLDYAFEAPDQWFTVPEAERDARTRRSSDVCIIDREDFFVRGCVEIPVVGTSETFIWGVWVSVSRESFIRIHEFGMPS